MKILVAGGEGQVGVELVQEARKRGYEVWGPGSAGLDISNKISIESSLRNFQPDVFINAAAYTDVDRAEEEKDKAFTVNGIAVGYLAEACKEMDVPFFHISTDYVFDGVKASPYSEHDVESPTCVYGASKLEGERLLRSVWHKHIILRVSWVFGLRGNNFFKTMLRIANERDEISVVDDQFGAPTASVDIARKLLDMAEVRVRGDDAAWGTYHLESNPGVTWYGFASEIFRKAVESGVLTNPPELKAVSSDEYKSRVKRPKNSKLVSTLSEPVDWRESLDACFLALKH